MNFVATPGDKSVFAAWLGDCSGNSSPCILVIPDGTDVLVRAVFAYVEEVAAHSVGDAMGLVERIALFVLGGVALTPMIAYLTTANVFIYLNIRYEFFYTARNR